MSSLLVHNYMTTGIALYMPYLEELEVRGERVSPQDHCNYFRQPQTVLGYAGLIPQQVRQLSSLSNSNPQEARRPSLHQELRDEPPGADLRSARVPQTSLPHTALSWGL